MKQYALKNPKLLTSMCSQAWGLMFRKAVPQPYIFIFNKPKRVALHMFFVFTTIDVLYLDKDKKVIEYKENFLPFTYYRPKNKASYIVELPKHTIAKQGIEKGTAITW